MTNETSSANASSGPMRNALCPCGSGKKYKRCCGAISGQSQATPNAFAGTPAENPHAADVLFRRGEQLLKSGEVVASMPVLLSAMRADPNHFDAHIALGSALIATGRFSDARAILTRAVSLRPDSAAAWRDLAVVFDRQNLQENAIAAYSKSAELAPLSGDARLRLAELYALNGRTEEAALWYERAADTAPASTKALLMRADALQLRGDMPAAESLARQAIAAEPESAAAHGTLAGILYTVGHFEEAETHFEAAVQLNPKMGRCWDGLARCRSFAKSGGAALDRMGAVLRRGDLGDSERMAIHFAMGKVCDDCGDYARAMEHFDAANALRAKDLVFDRAALAAMVDRNIARFTRDFFARSTAIGNPDSKPLFIAGMYRSGTTLVEQIVSGHPDIAAGGELAVWTPADIEIDTATGEFDATRTHAAIAKYLSVLKRIGPSAVRVTDKLPLNCFRLGAIHALLPNARIVHCRRNPVDTCLSIYTNLFRSRVSFAARKDDLVFFTRQYRRMMDHWREVLPANALLEVQYERLISSRESETRRLIAFTGVPWDDSCLHPERNRRAIGTASAWQARQPVYTTSLERWRRYEPWLGELRQLLSDNEEIQH